MASLTICRTCSQQPGKSTGQKITGGATFGITHKNVPIPELQKNRGVSDDNDNL